MDLRNWDPRQFGESVGYLPQDVQLFPASIKANIARMRDDATDEAIFQAIAHQAHMLVCAPCCHHELNEQIDSPLFRPLLRHGILKQRMGDLLTDTFRALALRIMGYRAEVIEFVAAEHTAKNLMIRAVRATAPGDQQFVREYNQLKQFWGVTPYIETLLGAPFQALIAHSS